MHRTVKLFVLLMLALIGYLCVYPSIIPVFEVALILNFTVMSWFMLNAFSSSSGKMQAGRITTAVIVLLFIVLDSVVFMGTYIRLEIMKHPVVRMSQKISDFQWTAFDGVPHGFSELSGHPSVLHFWATWCAPCRRELPQLIKYARSRPDITFVAFDLRDDREKALKFVEQSGGNIEKKDPPNVLYAWDPDSVVGSDVFKTLSLPTSLIVDAQGIMRLSVAVPVEWSDAVIVNALQRK